RARRCPFRGEHRDRGERSGRSDHDRPFQQPQAMLQLRAGRPVLVAHDVLPSVTVTALLLEPRLTVSATFAPGCRPEIALTTASELAVGCRFAGVITSPVVSPAAEAGEPPVTRVICAPPLASRPGLCVVITAVAAAPAPRAAAAMTTGIW